MSTIINFDQFKAYVLITLNAMAPLTEREIYDETPELLGMPYGDYCQWMHRLKASGDVQIDNDADAEDTNPGWYAKGQQDDPFPLPLDADCRRVAQ